MALFGLGKKNAAPAEPPVEAKKEAHMKPAASAAPSRNTASGGGSDLSRILRNPRITEKATAHSEAGVYTFDVSGSATKRSVREAVANIYHVTPRMVRIVRVPTKVRRSMRTGHRGVTRSGKKAYVYLREGDTITIT